MSNPLLEIKDLSLEFGKGQELVRAIDDISFYINKGETLGIVGESGSGKSVTALSILQLIPKKIATYPSGSIYFESKDNNLLSLKESEIRKLRGKDISIIFQNPMTSLNPSHKCGAQVLEAILLHQDVTKILAKQQVLDLFEQVELPDPERIYNSYPHQLSGGQIQRIMIAMAVANKPKLIIADEPTTALDVTVQKKIVSLLKNLKNKFGCAIMFISHDLGLVREIADRVVVMQHGKIVEEGNTASLFNKPMHGYTKGLIECRPPLDINLKRLPTVSQFLENQSFDIEEFKKAQDYSPEEIKARLNQLKTKNNILEVDGLSKWYTKEKNFWGKATSYTKAVDDVSFTIKEGETLGLVGESGSGKSTLGMTILRLLEARSGKILFQGKDVLSLNRSDLKKIRKDLQIIFQNPYASLNPRIRVGEAIKEPMHVHDLYAPKERKERTIELMKLVGLHADQYDRYPHQFSGGQRQRISIARTLAVEPKFIVCDECVSALDVSIQAQILNLLLELREKLSLSYIFISHDLSVVKFISDHIMVMKDGKIVEKNTTESIFNNPQEAYTQGLLDAIPKK